jgi:hypothetical protein
MSVNPSIERFFGNPVIDWTQPRRDPWPQDEVFLYCPTDSATGLPIEPKTPIYDTYDKAIASWYASWLRTWEQVPDPNFPGRQCVVKTDKTVPIVFATPERAFSQAAKLLCPGQKISFDTPGAYKNVPLPFASLEMVGDPEPDWTRWNNRHIRYGGLSYDNREMLQYKHPFPVNIVYQLSLWAKTKVELDGWTADFVRKFRDQELFIKVLHGQGFGIRCIPVRLEAIQQAVDLEPAQGQRSLRRVFQIMVMGWIPNEPYSVRTVLTYDVELAVSDDLENDPGEVEATITVNDVSDATTPGGGPEATRPLDGPFPDDC